MKILGYVMLHYGADYLPYVLHPLNIVCDKVVILYSLKPTHNLRTEAILPDSESRDNLKEIAEKFDKVEWIDVVAKSEAEHRGFAMHFTDGYDVMVNADSDEVWDIDDLKRAVKEVYNSPYKVHGIDGFIHFWRSFGYVVNGCEFDGQYYNVPDFFRPHRLWHLREKNTEKQPDIKAKIYHFGYAIKRRIYSYKTTIHGHRGEWRDDFNDMWNNWTPENTEGHFHPTSYQLWHKIEPFDRSMLPLFMHTHKFFNSDLI